MVSNHNHRLWKSSNEHSYMKIYTIPKSILKYRLSSILIHVSDITPFEEHQSLELEPLENALRPLRNPVQMVWSLSVVPAKFSGLRCASYGAMVLRLEMCIIMFLQLRRGGTLLPSNWNSVFRSTCLNQNHWAWTHHHVMIWRIGFSHMVLLKVGGHFTVPGFRVCSILYISCLYILICVVTKLETSKSMQNTNLLSLKPHTGKTEFFRPFLCRFFCCFEVWWQCQLPHPPMSPLFLTL